MELQQLDYYMDLIYRLTVTSTNESHVLVKNECTVG